ncbi:MAG: signal peptidase I, partial [Candidatus Babeliales bacterium]
MKTAHKYSSTIALVKELVVLLLIVFLIRTFVFGLYQVPTGSMERTMLVGERFFANKLPSFINPIRQGDIISFNDPTYIYSKNPWIRLFQQYVAGPINWTKRAIAVGPAVVRGVIEEGHPVIYVNDVRLEEPYVNFYPLIGIWPDNKEEKYEQAKKEAAALVLQGALDVSM